MNIFLDESGDLGWSLDAPYQRGGSSRYLVIAALLTPEGCIKHPERLIRQLYDHFQWRPRLEKKWVDMPEQARQTFAEAARNMLSQHPEIQCRAIVVNKRNVQPHLRQDSNLLYNYMTRLLLLEEMARHRTVHLMPDARSIKVESGQTFREYLQTELWYTAGARTVLSAHPMNSASSKGLQFADMLAGAIGSHYEFKRSAAFSVLQDAVPVLKLFF